MRNFFILSFTESSSDPRVLRQVRALGSLAKVVVFGYGHPPPGSHEFHKLNEPDDSRNHFLRKLLIGVLLLSGKFERFFWQQPHIRSVTNIEFPKETGNYIANDFDALVVLLQKAALGSKIYLDAREYTPDEIPKGQWFRSLLARYRKEWLVGKHIKRAAGVMTVSTEISEAYERAFEVEAPTVVLNVPDFLSLIPSSTNPKIIRLVHHGIASRSRKLDLLIKLLELLDKRFELHFLLVPMEEDKVYMEELKNRATRSPRSHSIHFHDAVPTAEISRFINQFDIGVFFHLPETKNAELALPNKFFEFIQGRLAVAIGPSPSMKAIVETNNLGVVSGDFSIRGLAEKLNNLRVEDIITFKENSDKAAKVFNSDEQIPRILSVLGLED